MILLPDSWTLPDGLTFTPGNQAWGKNTYTIDQWTMMEDAGAVFLPASGSCNSQGIPSESTQNQNGFYRASTAAYYLHFRQGTLQNCTASFYQYGDAVRLVKDKQLEQDCTLQQDAEGYYLLGSVQDWKDFAALVQTKPAAKARMTADIDLGTEITMIAEDLDHPYKGTFDGQGHTLTLSLSVSGETACAPFRYVEGATIVNLHTTGTVYADNNASQFRSGLVGLSAGNTTIQNCWSSVTIQSRVNGFGVHGGFIGMSNSGKVTISNCLFDGSFDGSKTTDWGGFVGSSYSTTTISNSVFAPAKISIYHLNSATFSPNNVTTNNCYYSQALNNETNGATAIGSRSADDLAEALGSGWQVKDGKVVPVTVAPDLVNPVFSGTVPSGYTSAEAIATALVEASSKSTYVDFIGTYSPIVWETENRSVLFLGGNNTLYFPQPDGDNNPHVNAFRGYFQLNGITAGDITEARMNFDGEENITGIVEAEANSSLFILHSSLSEWYTLDGRKLNSQPTQKGVYIHNGRVVVK